MNRTRPRVREGYWVAVSLWVAAVALFAIWHEGTEVDRLRFWADSVEWAINADPLVSKNATELRSKLGDEKFIAEAPAAYPEVDLHETLERYEADRASRSRFDHPLIAFAFWALIPPALLYVAGVITGWIRARPLPSRS